ncbi:MAG: T9SS type A sorting domain-containing protein, partial [Bacteroidota bacterium]
LNIDADFTNNTAWRFVAKDFVFTNPQNPWADNFPELMNFNNLEESYMAADFVAIKVGDVNGSVQANSLLHHAQPRGASTLELEVEDRFLQVGQTASVRFTGNLSQVAGYQFTLNHQGLELVNIEEATANAANAANFGSFEGQLTASWHKQANASSESETAFVLTFQAKEAMWLSDALALNSSRTPIEAYTSEGELQHVALNFTSAGFALYQNQPNPFQELTTVAFALPTAQAATLTITDAAGKVLRVINANYTAGYHEVTLEAKSLATGVLSYTLATEDFTATKKMVILE